MLGAPHDSHPRGTSPSGGDRDRRSSPAYRVAGDLRGMLQISHGVVLHVSGSCGASRSVPGRKRSHQLTDGEAAAPRAVKLDGIHEPIGVAPAHRRTVPATRTHLPGDPLTLDHRPAPVARLVGSRPTPRVESDTSGAHSNGEPSSGRTAGDPPPVLGGASGRRGARGSGDHFEPANPMGHCPATVHDQSVMRSWDWRAG